MLIVEMILIIGPNGEVRQILGEFKVKNVEDLKEGKVIVETDGYGEPNDRSGSILGSYIGMLAKSPTFAPLDIPKWDNDLFLQRKKNIITNVEVNCYLIVAYITMLILKTNVYL